MFFINKFTLITLAFAILAGCVQHDYYATLNVSKSASPEELKSSWKTLILLYHPDKNKDEEAADMFKRVNEAYEVLSNQATRSQYDNAQNEGSSTDTPFYGYFNERKPLDVYIVQFTVKHLFMEEKISIDIPRLGQSNYINDFFITDDWKFGDKRVLVGDNMVFKFDLVPYSDGRYLDVVRQGSFLDVIAEGPLLAIDGTELDETEGQFVKCPASDLDGLYCMRFAKRGFKAVTFFPEPGYAIGDLYIRRKLIL